MVQKGSVCVSKWPTSHTDIIQAKRKEETHNTVMIVMQRETCAFVDVYILVEAAFLQAAACADLQTSLLASTLLWSLADSCDELAEPPTAPNPRTSPFLQCPQVLLLNEEMSASALPEACRWRMLQSGAAGRCGAVCASSLRGLFGCGPSAKEEVGEPGNHTNA